MSDRPQDAQDGRKDAPRRPSADEARLEELKRLIESGQYETEEKLAATTRLMLADLQRLAAKRRASREGGSGGGPL